MRFNFWLFFHLSAFATISGTCVAAEHGLLEPDWSDPSVARARANLKAPSASLTNPGEAMLSLPRWGLGVRIDKLNPDEATRSRGLQAPDPQLTWPKCAAKTPKVAHVRDESGLWYTDNYDFGCLKISIGGDRTFNSDAAMQMDAAPSDACSAQALAAPVQADEEGDSRGRFELEVSLNKIPYAIKGSCTDGAEAFCEDRKSQCALIGKLILLGGSPQ